MPFGYEEQLYNEKRAAEIITPDDVEYLDVTILNKKDGAIIPLYFVFEGREIKIDKVLGKVAGTSLKSKLSGMRYRCKAMGKDFNLYYDGVGWYISK